jgi:hypothetical protein
MSTSKKKPVQNAHRVNAAQPKLLYDRKSAAHALSISVRSLDYLIARKELAFRKIGKKVMIQHAELLRFSRQNHFEPVAS